jgi:surface protein
MEEYSVMTARYVHPAVAPLRGVLCEDALVYISEYLKPTFKDNEEFREGIRLWFDNRDECVVMYGHISNWNTENITNMSRIFLKKEHFNEPIGNWDVRNVTNMDLMFARAGTFNQPLDSWNVDNVTDMRCMFAHASSFNQPLVSWNVGNVTDGIWLSPFSDDPRVYD